MNSPVNILFKHILQAMVAQGNSDAVNTSVKSVNLISLFHQLIGVLTSRDSMLTHPSLTLSSALTHTPALHVHYLCSHCLYIACVCVCVHFTLSVSSV